MEARMRTVAEIILAKESFSESYGVLAIHVGSGPEHWSIDGRDTARFVLFRPTPADLRQLAREAEKLAGLIEELDTNEPSAAESAA